jgi:hypothetical protein
VLFPELEDPAKYISALLVLDAAISKAKGGDPRDPFARAMDVEVRLAQVLVGTFFKRARKATVWAVDQVTSSPAELDERAVFHIVDGIHPFFDGWMGEVTDTVHACTTEAFKLGKEVGYVQAFNPHLKPAAKAAVQKAVPKGSKFLEVKPNFTQQDQAAIDALASHQTFWIGKFYDDKLSNKIAAASKAVLLDQGLGRREAAKRLQQVLTDSFGFDPEAPKGLPGSTGVSIPNSWKGSTLQYLDGLAANVVTVARNHGQIGAYHEIGVSHYEIVNPKDEKTCLVCGAMAGKVFEVHVAKTMQELEVNGDYTPDQIKTYRPWARSQKDLDKIAGTDVKAGHVSAEESKKLAAGGFAYAPFHFKCRCSTDVSESSELEFEQAPAKPAPPPPPAPPTSPTPPPNAHPGDVHGLPTGATSGPSTPLAPSGPPRPADFPWQEKQLTAKAEQLGGMHPKTVFVAPDGSEWIYKPQEEWRALVDIAANDVQRLVGIETNDIYMVRLQGKVGSIQKRFTGVVGTMDGVALDKIGADDMAAIQHEHMFDWLVSQHDTHPDNLLRFKSVAPKGIDKGQAFRFFGQDRFDLTYGQPGEPNPSGTFYHTVFNAYASGKNVKLAPFSQVDAFIRKAESVTDADYLNAIRPYAMKAFKATNGWGGKFKSEAEFMDAVLERKKNLRGTVEDFYHDLEVRRAKALGLPAPKKPSLGVTQPSPAVMGEAWKKPLELAAKGHWDGASFFIGGPDYEGYHWRMYGAQGGGSFMESRLRPAADKKLRAALGILADSKKGAPDLPNDALYPDVLSITKHYNYHMDPASSGYDGKIKPEVEAKAKSLASAMKIVMQAGSPSEKEMATHYATHLSKIFDGDKFKLDGLASKSDEFKLVQFVPKPKLPTAGEPQKKDIPPAGWKVEKVAVSDPIGRRLVNGKIVADGGPQSNDAQSARDQGDTYKISAPGVTIYYQPHAPNVGYSVQGAIKLHVTQEVGHLSAAEVDRTFRTLEQLGLETRHAGRPDMEMLYLRKVGFAEKIDTSHIGEALPVETQIEQLKDLLTKKVGDHFKGSYNFMPTWDGPTEGRGEPRWMGHYIPDSHIAGMRGYHDLTYGGNGSSQAEALKPVIAGDTHTLASIRERLRLGVYNTGASPSTDMASGGASYAAYARVRGATFREPGVYFKSELFKDLDAVRYRGDEFGRVQPTTLATRAVPADIASIEKRRTNDETIFKNSVNLDKWLDEVVVSSERERKGLISFFKENGYKEYAGKRVEDLVKVSR